MGGKGLFDAGIMCSVRACESRLLPIGITWESLVVASQAYLAASIAAGHAQESRVGAMRVVAGRTFHIGSVQYGFAG